MGRLHSADPPRVLTIAGSDSGGGAGIQADLKTFQALGAYGMSVLTALTAQNTRGVQAIHDVPEHFVVRQLDSLLEDVRIDAVKIGMLSNHRIILALAERLSQVKTQTNKGTSPDPPIVLDPVMVSTSGSLLLTQPSIDSLISRMLPLCTLLTPNLPEARQLLNHAQSLRGIDGSTSVGNDAGDEQRGGEDLQTIASLMHAARELSRMGPRSVLVKGGHQRVPRRQLEQAIDALRIKRTGVWSSDKVDWDLSDAASSARASDTDPRSAEQNKSTSGTSPLAAEADLGELPDGIPIAFVRSDHHPGSCFLKSMVHRSPIIDVATERKSTAEEDVVVDVLFEAGANNSDARVDGRYTVFIKPHIASTATHGTGCTLSSAIAAHLGAGLEVRQAVSLGIDYVQSSIARGLASLGSGPGPLNHGCAIAPRGVLARAPPHDAHPLCASLLRRSRRGWLRFVGHPFVRRVADGSLARADFAYFLRQDYLFLRHYARVWASGAASSSCSRSFADVALFASTAASMAREAETHATLCARWGVTREQLERATPESAATLAYTRFVLDVARGGDAVDLLVATAPCMLGYAEVGMLLGDARRARGDEPPSSEAEVRIGERASADEHRRALDEWAQTYESDEYRSTALRGVESLEERCERDPPSPLRRARLQQIWDAALALEVGMWDEALDERLRRAVVEPLGPE